MHFRLYNRFGELVFETHSLAEGWDGNYKGKPQAMDVFAYVLEATFIDGKSVRKAGNITLLR
jgi:gliding motility-associated-like protein